MALPGTSGLKKAGFSLSLSFCSCLNLFGSPQLQGLCQQQSLVMRPQKPRQPLLFSGAGAIWEDVTARKGFQIRRCFGVWSNEIFNPCSILDMHHHRFTYQLLTDSSSWQGRWQLTYINPAAQHKLSLQSRNPSLLFKPRGVSVGAWYHRQVIPALKSRHCWDLSEARGSHLSRGNPSTDTRSTSPRAAQWWGYT